MDYYRRYGEDGSCEMLCTRCFTTLGRAKGTAEAKLLEAAHICSRQSDPRMRRLSNQSLQISKAFECQVPADRPAHVVGNVDGVETLLLLLSIILCLYLLPSVIEFEMMKRMGAWISCIFFGDLVGCSFLSLVLEMKKTGILLYGFLTGAEGWLYAARLLPVHLLPWVVDIGPTLVTACLIVSSFLFRSMKAAPAK